MKNMETITSTQIINIESARMFGTARQAEGFMSADDLQMVVNSILYTWDMAPVVPAQYCANALRKVADLQERTGSSECAEYANRQWEMFSQSYGL
jgi:hypothetical protein